MAPRKPKTEEQKPIADEALDPEPPELVEAEAGAPIKVGPAKVREETAKAEAEGPKSPQQIATEMARDGVPEAVIMMTLNTMFGGGDGQGAPPKPRTPGDGETGLGPDPAMVAAYQERMAKGYKKPRTKWPFNALRKDDPELQERITGILGKVDPDRHGPEEVVAMLLEGLDGFGGVILPRMFLEWCVQWQFWQETIRRMPSGQHFSEAKVIEDMVRYHWFNHPQERARLQMARNPNVKSGPADMFKPGAGGWTG